MPLLPEVAMRYLLGELAPDDETAIDERILREEDAVQEIAIAENELYDAYARNELSDARSAAFARRFLHRPEARRRVAVARGLAERARGLAGGRWTLRRTAVVAVVFAAALVAFLVLSPWKRGPSREELAVIDLPMPTRNGALTTVPLPASGMLELRPELGEAIPDGRFRLTLVRGDATVAGPTVVEAGARPGLLVPAMNLRPGTYLFRVESARPGDRFEDIGRIEVVLVAR
jgi:anti-sigma-K factor RskA